MRTRAIVRKHDGPSPTDTLDVAAAALVEVTSEQELFPIDHVFDGRTGPGGSCWVAATSGAQAVVLRFHEPNDVETVIIESEERSSTCVQRIELEGWSAHRQGPFDAPPRVLSYSPYGTSFHREIWDVSERSVTHVCIRVTPAPLSRFATLTAIVLR